MAQHLIGVISDTHGLVRPEALEALRGADLIVHAGDAGNPQVLAALGEIAPVVAVRGNVDRGEWVQSLRKSEVVEVGEILLYVLHDVTELEFSPAAVGIAAVISGHSHQPGAEWRDGVLFLNPGSAGPRRFSLPVTIARLRVDGKSLDPQIVEILNV